ncbi:hypothetical protein CBQ28_07920 [Pseudoalteromonas sp. GCY]|nr:hypothetical protein CBQ28_07920 [Pseudoalteromonas sp. GCY]
MFRARDYLFDNWQDNISLDELECLTDSTRFQLIKGFNLAFGLIPHQFLLQIKIQKAKLLAKGMTCVDTVLTSGLFSILYKNMPCDFCTLCAFTKEKF